MHWRKTNIKVAASVPPDKKQQSIEPEVKKAIVNIENEDNKCFIWSVFAALHPIPYKSNPERVHHYRPFLNELNFAGIELPVPVRQNPTFEKQNKIADSVF